MTDAGRYKMRTIARLTGFTPTVLRAWERRHGLLQPVRGAGGHRLFTEDDRRVLDRVRVHLDAGRSIGEVATLGRAALLAEAARGPRDPGPGAGRAAGPDRAVETESSVEAITSAAVDLDEATIVRSLDRAFAVYSPLAALHDVVVPAAHRVGDLWADGRCSVASEHLASGHFVHRARKILETSCAENGHGARIVSACLPDEQHVLGVLLASIELARAGGRIIWLGASLPFEDLERACLALRPEAALLSVTRPVLLGAHGPSLGALVERLAGRVRFVVGGAGVAGDVEAIERAGAVVWKADRGLDELPDVVLGR